MAEVSGRRLKAAEGVWRQWLMSLTDKLVATPVEFQNMAEDG